MTTDAPRHGEPRRGVRAVDGVAWQEVDGRVVMLKLDAERYYRLDDVGSRMWELLYEHGDIEAAYTILRDEYDVDPAVLRTDLDNLVTRLVDAGLLEFEALAA